jgi:hypothetical protein
MEPVSTLNRDGDRQSMDGIVVFVLESHWTQNNPKGWREMDRGELRKLHPSES